MLWKYALGYAALGLAASVILFILILYLGCGYDIHRAARREGWHPFIRVFAVIFTPLTLLVWSVTLRHTNHKRRR